MTVTLHHGDALDVLATLPAESVDAVVTDPPYELGFMGRAWDQSGIAYNIELWKQCLRVLKPGGHLLAFGGTRTSHRLACAIEDAGFDIRDSIAWLYGSGFPKSLDVSKAIDKARDDRPAVKSVSAFLAAATRAAGLTDRDLDREFGFAGRMAGQWLTQAGWVLLPGWEQWERLRALLGFGGEMDAEVWRLNGRKGTPGDAWAEREVIGERTTGISTGRGAVPYIGDSDNRDVTAPATDEAKQWSGWGTALKPAHEPIVVARKPLIGTVAANVLAHGTGALNIDACRVDPGKPVVGGGGWAAHKVDATAGWDRPYVGGVAKTTGHDAGRWPTNVVLDEDSAATLDEQSGTLRGGERPARRAGMGFDDGEKNRRGTSGQREVLDTGGASRFFPVFRYQAKAPTRERPKVNGVAHPTVKPLELMRWLVRLVTPPGGFVLDPFAGSGTTLQAAALEGMDCIGVEREATFIPLIRARLVDHADALIVVEPAPPAPATPQTPAEWMAYFNANP
jgi:hypothetical protein